MKKLILTLALLLSSCVPQVPCCSWDAGRDDVVYVADSNGHWTRIGYQNLQWVKAGITGDAHRGRRLIDYNDLPNVNTVFLALGVNDALKSTPTHTFEIHLNDLLLTTNATTYCVLPVSTVLDVDPYRDIMKNNCTNTIDPYEIGIVVENEDGIHWGVNDHSKMASKIKELIN